MQICYFLEMISWEFSKKFKKCVSHFPVSFFEAFFGLDYA